jgi:serine/threonine protein kinase/Tol biopolymer transport system component
MALSSGNRLGPYEILSAIGAGGMGEVYRARDTKLGRDVAIKVLSEAFARDTDRMARFQREAKVLASLNHPNIATIYGLEDSGDTHALVMELVEGPTLADRIKQGPIPVDEAIRIARQIADALEYAHERGIIHRDLKPANVKVTNDDAVKVLDFGLAKALEGDPSSFDISTSPTISRMATMQGVLLGTAAYMSPEQAKAKSVDRRADIWAFGCVLYEMLTSKQTFTGETVTDTLASIIKEEPDWKLLPSTTPMRVRVLLQRCLQKDPKQRLRDIGDARISLDEVVSGAPEQSPATAPISTYFWQRALPWAIAASFLAGVALALVVVHFRERPHASAAPVQRYEFAAPDPSVDSVGALSPDGTRLVLQSSVGNGPRLWLRRMDSLGAHPIEGTENASGGPFWSPDSRLIIFSTVDGKLKKIDMEGGPAQVLCDSGVAVLGGFWTPDGKIVFSDPARPPGLWEVPSAGGVSSPVPGFEHAGNPYVLGPVLLPDGRHFLYTSGNGPTGDVYLGSLDSKLGHQGSKKLLNAAAGYAPSPNDPDLGYLLLIRTVPNTNTATLLAQSFDLRKLELVGEPVTIAQQVSSASVSDTGSLVYVSGSGQVQSRLGWVSRNGTEQPLTAPAKDYGYPRLSPDGHRVALVSGGQIWLYDPARDTLTRFTFEGSNNGYPTWTPDGKRIAFTSDKGGSENLYWQMADGSGGLERLTTSQNLRAPLSWSPDAELLAFIELSPTTAADIWVLQLNDRKAQPFLQTPAYEGAPQFSPDGHWMAYASNESGRFEIYVQPYPGPGGKWQISTDGGNEPVWNRSGRELFYRNADKMIAVDVTTQPSFSAGKPKMLFEGRYEMTSGVTFPNYDVSPDGQRFLMLKPVQLQQAAQFTVVLNWPSLLKK